MKKIFRIIALACVALAASGQQVYRLGSGDQISIRIAEVEEINDKANHFLAFGALALLGDFSFPVTRFALKKFLWLLSYGVLIECIQYFLPYREASLLDVMADATGLAIYWLFNRILRFIPLLGQRWR